MSGHCKPAVITRPIALGSQRRLAVFLQIYRHASLLRGRYFSAGTREVRVTADLLPHHRGFDRLIFSRMKPGQQIVIDQN